jgi:Ras-related protein Rab-1A
MQGLYSIDLSTMGLSSPDVSLSEPGYRVGHSFHSLPGSGIILFGGFMNDRETSESWKLPVGNWALPGSLDNSIYRLTCDSLSWSQDTVSGPPPSPRAFAASCMSQGKLYIHGGYTSRDFDQISDSFFMYDPTTCEWSSLPRSGPGPRAGHGIAAVNEFLYLFGDHLLENNNVYRFDTMTLKWECIPVRGTPPPSRRFLSMDTVGSSIFVVGGDSNDMLGDMYIFDTRTCVWTKPLYNNKHPLCLRGQASCVLGHKLMVFGGLVQRPSLIVAGLCDVSLSDTLSIISTFEVEETEGMLDIKFLTIGDSGVGKSCLLTRFVSNEVSKHHMCTVGSGYKTVVTMCQNLVVRLQLWDTAGRERSSDITGTYFRQSDVFVIVYDATNRTSFEHVDAWLSQIKQFHNMQHKVTLLCANKADLVSEVVVSEREGRAKAESIGALFVPTSAQTSRNVDYAFLTATQRIVEMRSTIRALVH